VDHWIPAVDLIARLPAFDPERGSLGGFAGTVMAHSGTRIARKENRQHRLFGAIADRPWPSPRRAVSCSSSSGTGKATSATSWTPSNLTPLERCMAQHVERPAELRAVT
jgi:hypothetical protein